MSRRSILLALIVVAAVINYLDRGNLSIAVPSIMRDFRMSPSAMGVVLSAFFWTYAVFQVPSGAFVDRFGIRWTFAGAFLVWSIASASIAFTHGPGGIIGSRAVLGLAETVGQLASIAFIRSNYSGKDQGLPTAILIAGGSFGPGAAALVGTVLLNRFGWRLMFAITGLGGLFWVPCWLAAAPSNTVLPVRQASKEPEDLARPRQWTWRMLLTNRVFWAMSLSILFSSYYWYFVLTWVPSYLIFSRGFSTLGMGRVVSIGLFAMAIVTILAGAVVDRVAAGIGVFRARLWFAVVGRVVTGVILLLLIIPNRSWTLPIFTLSMCATGIAASNYWTIIQHASPKNMVGRSVGFLNTMSVLAGIAAPVVTGLILGPEKRFGPALLVAGVCPFLAAACLVVAGSKGLARMKALLAGEVYLDAFTEP